MKYYLLEETLPEDEQRKNRELGKCYLNIIDNIRRTSACVDDESLKEIIEIDYRKLMDFEKAIYEGVTRFCKVTLCSSDSGKFYIVFSLDCRALDMLGIHAFNNLVRNVYRFSMIGFTEESIEHRVVINSHSKEIEFDEMKAFWEMEDNRPFTYISN